MTSEKEIIHKLRTNLEYFCKHAPAMVSPKEGGSLVPFHFNSSQKILHKMLEKQKKETGRVRAIILKGRQLGCSTYVANRFYHITRMNKGYNVFILCHLADATAELFQKVKVIHENQNKSLMPPTSYFGKNQLVLEQNNASYSLGTAKSGSVGRSKTIQLFHGSECAYYDSPQEIKKGVMQAIAKHDGTEVILESTANGMDDFFYEFWNKAKSGENGYLPVFLPWFMGEDYIIKLPEGFKLSEEEEFYKEKYELDDSQIMFRRQKIAELGGAVEFMQEYPSYEEEAFITSGTSLVPAKYIIEARKNNLLVNEIGQKVIIGTDGGRVVDPTVILIRRGRKVLNYYKFDKMTQTEYCRIIMEMIGRYNAHEVNMDVMHGYGTYDMLREAGLGMVNAVAFNAGADEKDIYMNKRAEMYGRMKDWLLGGDKDIPDDGEFHRQIAAIPNFKRSSSMKKQLPSKEDIKKSTKSELDIVDAFVLTFANWDNKLESDVIRKREIKRVVRPFKLY